MKTQVHDDTAGALSRRRRYGVLAICSMSLLMVGLDVTIVNVALPSIGHSFHAPLSGLQWTIDAYTLVLASLLMMSGSTADRLGRRRTFVSGLSIFAVGSLLCSVAPSLALLVVFRMIQAVGGSMLNPVAMSIITNTFTNAKERAQAIGVWAAVIGISMALGPVLGGILVTSVGWQSIFWVNVPVGVVAIVLALRFIPESKAPIARKVDIVGQLLIMVFLASLTYAIIESPRSGWTSPVILGSLVVALISITAFIQWERRVFEPLVDMRFFRSIPFVSATLIAIAAFAGLGGFLFLNTIYLQDVRGLSPFHAGLRTLPMAVMAMLLPPVSGRILSRRGGRIPLVIAGVTLSLSCLMLVNLQATTSYAWLFGAYLVFGIGFGFVNAPITNTAVAGMPRAQAGVAASIASTSRQIGATVGVAVVGSLAASSLHHARHPSISLASHPGWWVLTGCGAAILVIGLVATSSKANETARTTAALINPEYLEEVVA
ncbi:MAG: MFS transporter [Acidimicrobiales bacterium]